ncbi:MAG TPA: dienelactone hydrolase family protein [Tepidisphaeraceae bacterium]|jgi:carboxymethylenebutenolidase
MRKLCAIALMAMCGVASAAAPGTPGGLPPDANAAKAVLDKSPRHGEWIDIMVPNQKTPLKSYIVYPERKDKAPVVMVIHEIFGESDWVRGVADQLAADGFIAIAPDMLSGHGPNGGGTDSLGEQQAVVNKIREVKPAEVMADLNATREYALKLPSANGKTATVGFCWGGGQSFAYAAAQPGLNAAAVYYGTPPKPEEMAKIKAPVAGFYGGNDNRVTGTVEGASAEMGKLNKPYTPHIYEGAGHGFLRQQDGGGGANMKATEQAWPATIAFLRENTK